MVLTGDLPLTVCTLYAHDGYLLETLPIEVLESSFIQLVTVTWLEN